MANKGKRALYWGCERCRIKSKMFSAYPFNPPVVEWQSKKVAVLHKALKPKCSSCRFLVSENYYKVRNAVGV